VIPSLCIPIHRRDALIRTALCATTLAALGGPASALDVGALAPDFELPGAEAVVRLSQYRGKVVYLDFWASWCGPCKQSFPWMNSVQAKYGAQGLKVLAINVDTRRDDARKFLLSSPAAFDLAYDAQGKTPRLYDVKTMPSSYVIDRAGRLSALHRGFSSADTAGLEQAIRQALEGAQ
jgi:cytochrome c biogenesis protein CcmG, thiol:disulfide interchange protein DsbE